MMIKSLGRLLLIGGLAAAAGSVTAQVQEADPRPAPGPVMPYLAPCPNPTVTTLNATGSSVFNGDFSAVTLANLQPIGGTALNKHTAYTFRWSPPACCAVTRATLTVVLRSNSQGTSNTTSDAGNDTISVTHMGASVPGLGGFIRPNTPFGAQTSITRTFTLTGAQLTNLNANNRLSFVTQDDHTVVSATLKLDRCCINK